MSTLDRYVGRYVRIDTYGSVTHGSTDGITGAGLASRAGIGIDTDRCVCVWGGGTQGQAQGVAGNHRS